ncbi:hypothetical protein C8J56DRAFT_282046 [Mycena floridula]|nr:hypothetical protein C8J56DRAFT_282046 [Mycena floridula]
MLQNMSGPCTWQLKPRMPVASRLDCIAFTTIIMNIWSSISSIFRSIMSCPSPSEQVVVESLDPFFTSGTHHGVRNANDVVDEFLKCSATEPELSGAVVTSIQYCKADKGSEHEFLLVYIKAANPDGKEATTHLIIEHFGESKKLTKKDREKLLNEASKDDHTFQLPVVDDGISEQSRQFFDAQSIVQPTLVASSRPSYASSSTSYSLARDEITIFRSENLVRKHLKSRYGSRWSSLATRTFHGFHPGEQPLTVAALLVLCRTVSSNCPEYNLIISQCYWYANSIWEVLALRYPAKFTDSALHEFKRRGRCRLLSRSLLLDWSFGCGRHVPEGRQPKDLLPVFNGALERFHEQKIQIDEDRKAPLVEAERRMAAELAEKDAEIVHKDAENALLRSEIERLRLNNPSSSWSST